MLPNLTNRTVILGSTGSGKTQGGLWLLVRSYGDYFEEMPFIIIDFKGDELVEKINPPVMSLTGKLPESGLWVVRPLPGDEDLVENFCQRIWERGYIGLFIDEGTMMPRYTKYFGAIQTQGRSLRIPCITCTQRPVELNKKVFTEASYFMLFNLNTRDDRKHVRSYMDGEEPELLPRYHFRYYNVGENSSSFHSPVPDADTIVQMFHDIMPSKLARI